MKDPSSLGRHLGEEYMSFSASEENIEDIHQLEKNSGAKDIWSREELRKIYRLSSCSMVVVYKTARKPKPVCYLAFSVRNNRLSLWNLAVHSEHRLQGLGSKMIQWVAREHSKMDMTATVRESDLASQVFLRQSGFTFMKIVKGSFRAPVEDGYYFAMRSLR